MLALDVVAESEINANNTKMPPSCVKIKHLMPDLTASSFLYLKDIKRKEHMLIISQKMKNRIMLLVVTNPYIAAIKANMRVKNLFSFFLTYLRE